LNEKNTVVLGASFDTVEENRAFVEKYDFPYSILCDTDRALGLAYKACAEANDGYPRRITYVISADGIIEQAIETSDPAEQASELLKAL
jgi:peroxiredoxin Q/BCP